MNSAPVTQASPKDALVRKISSARANILILAAFTLINCVLCLINADTYFLFSALLPYRLSFYAMYLTGRFPSEFYAGDTFEFFGDGVFYALVAAALVIIALYALCYFLSKKSSGWFIAALAFFSVDCVYFLVFMVSYGFSADLIVDILFHIWVMFYLVRGVTASAKLKKLPEQPLETSDSAGCYTVPETQNQTPTETNSGETNSDETGSDETN